MIHELKLRREFFDYVRFGIKKFEIRKDDRGFNVGDTLVLKESTKRAARQADTLCGRWIIFTAGNSACPATA